KLREFRARRGSQRLEINRVVVIGWRDPHRGLVAHARKRAKNFITRGRRCCRAILRIERDDEDALTGLRDELAELGSDRWMAVTHGPLDHELPAEQLERAGKFYGLRAGEGGERGFVAFVVPDPGVVARFFAWPNRQDHGVEDELPQRPLILDHPRVAEKFLQIAPHGSGIGGLGRAEIDEQHADLAAGNCLVDVGNRGGRGRRGFVHCEGAYAITVPGAQALGRRSRADERKPPHTQSHPTGRSSTITLPSLGRLPEATSSTSPESFVTAR